MEIIKVIFDIPRNIQIALDSGEYIRRGGVIVDKKGKIVMWLRDGHLINESGQIIEKIGNFARIAESAINIATVILLNEKLKQIQMTVQSIDENVEILSFNNLLSANDLLRRSEGIVDKQIQISELSTARNHYVQANNIYKQKINKALEKASKHREEYFSKFEFNKYLVVGDPIIYVSSKIKKSLDQKAIKKMNKELGIACEYVKVVILSYMGISKSYYLQNEKGAALNALQELQEFLVKFYDQISLYINQKAIIDMETKLRKLSINSIFNKLNQKNNSTISYLHGDIYEGFNELKNNLHIIQAYHALAYEYKDEIQAISYDTEIKLKF
jgi:hypothetical protein